MNSIFSQQNIFKVCCIVIEWETAWIFFVNEIYSLALVNHDLWVYLVVEKNWAAGFKLIFVHETQDWDIVLAANTEYIYTSYILHKTVQFNSIDVFRILFCRAGEPEPGVLGSLEQEPAEKKNRSRSRMKKKSRSRSQSRLKKNEEPEPKKN